MLNDARPIFVTGGSRGIGRATVLECLKLGYEVAFTFLDTPAERAEADAVVADANAAFPGRPCRAYVLDVRSSAAVDAVAERVVDDFGSVYGVVCNAGIVSTPRLASQVTDEEWEGVIATNLTGAFYTCRAFIDHMLSNRRGRIVMLSSLNRDGAAGTTAYSASKAAVVGLAKSIAKEYGPAGITCNCVAPGLVETDLTRRHVGQPLQDFWSTYCSVKRFGRTDEVAYAIGFLLSERASLVNGVVLPATGGLDWFP